MELEIFVTGKGIQMFGHNPRGGGVHGFFFGFTSTFFSAGLSKEQNTFHKRRHIAKKS